MPDKAEQHEAVHAQVLEAGHVIGVERARGRGRLSAVARAAAET